uniref:Uncharacterized protein n=1 Tax=Vibrio sp. FF_291 TaxID=1652832 RepID=A0A0H3ZUT3_9VIBR|nr:hypothetical protein [Vibrio sp. FF_291]
MKKLITLGLSALLTSSLALAATTDYVNVKTVNQYSLNNADILSANLTDLSPKAIEIGLREAELLANADYDEKNKILILQWHSIAKTVKGTKLSENLDEPLTSKIKLSDANQIIQARQPLIAAGEVEGIIDAYNRLLKKAEESIEVDASKKTLESNNENDFTNKSNGSGGGFLGDNDSLNENNKTPDVEVNTDEIIESVEKCSMRVDLEMGVVSEQERVIKTSSKTGEVIEVGNCQNSGQSFPIRKDFEAGCTLQLDKNSGTYNKGYKLYSMVEGSRYDISECEWSDENKVNYHLQRDFDSCNFDSAVINAQQGFYNPAFVNFTVIDGKRYDVSSCETDPAVKKELPTRIEQCPYRSDFSSNTAFEQNKTITLSPDKKVDLLATNCTDTGKTFSIEKDFEVTQCNDLPNFHEAKLYFGFKKYITVNDKKEYLTACQTSPEDTVSMSMTFDNCKASENLTTNIATIKKKWMYSDDSGKQILVSDCVETDETYPIVQTTETCTPLYIPEQNTVLIQGRQGWLDNSNEWHFVSECRPFSEELEVKSETCDPLYEHDFVGGNSYLRTRNYYEWNGERKYLNSCTRDPAQSFPHTKTATGCPIAHDDTNLRTRIFTRVMMNNMEIRGCEADSQFVPYQFTGEQLVGNFTQSFVLTSMSTGNSDANAKCENNYPATPYGGSISTACAKMDITRAWGANYGFNPSAGASATVTKTCSSSPNSCANCSNPGTQLSFTFYTQGKINADVKRYRRMDGSIYTQYNNYTCSQ